MEREIVMYVRSFYCPTVALARDILQRYEIPYREIDVDRNPAMADRLKAWTGGYLSAPTLVIANPGQELPYTEQAALPDGQSPRGYDRGPMITEPNNKELENWLHKHGFLDKPYRR